MSSLVTAAVVVSAATVYSAQQARSAAKAQSAAAASAQQQADIQTASITDQTNALKTQIDQQKAQMEQQQNNFNAQLSQQQASAAAAAQKSDEAFNAANQTKPVTEGFVDANKRQGQGGQAGTMLTGSTGISAPQLTLGKSTLLGA